MANTELIGEYIRSRGYKLSFVAQMLDLSPSALHHKLVGDTQFKLDEAAKLSTMLGLTMVERDACFFDEAYWVEYTTHPRLERRDPCDSSTAPVHHGGTAAVRQTPLAPHRSK